MLAARFDWPQTVVDAQDDAYIAELMEFLRAEGDHAETERRKQDRERRR